MTKLSIEEMVEEFFELQGKNTYQVREGKIDPQVADEKERRFLIQALTEAHQAGRDEAVEVVKSVRIEGKNRHANDKTEDQRDYLNDWILPVIKKEIIKALQNNK